MPRPTEPGRRYVAGLDGIRALAVLCVIVYHLGFSWAGGGMLGVGVFFTLSGYLITDLLLSHRKAHGGLGLRTFWLRRARRLLPALFVMLAVISVVVAIADAGSLPGVRRQVISGLFYFANWLTIAQHGSYFARFSPPLPLDHLWSLSIEEQFYLVWPLVLLVAIWVTRGRRRLTIWAVALAIASLIAMGVLYHPGYDPTRVYEGTDTRAFGLLIGCALAMARPSWEMGRPGSARARNWLDGAGLAGVLTILVLVWQTDPFTAFLYPYGFLLLSLATTGLIAAAVHPGTRLSRVLSVSPLRWIGVRSYGIYLWQWPIIVLLNRGSGGFHWGTAAIEVGLTFIIATLSWRFVEDPIRRGALVTLRRRWRAAASSAVASRRRLALSGSAAAVLLPVLGLAGVLPAASMSLGQSRTLLHSLPGPLRVADYGGQSRRDSTPTRTLPPVNPKASTATHTSCHSAVYIGDSTSEGETSSNYIPDRRLRLPHQLTRVGVRHVFAEISGARSIVETYEGHPNGATVAQQYISRGYKGCWILALGTNDVADVRIGGRPAMAGRIQRMMKVIGSHPVLWVDALTLLASGSPYAEPGMRAWNRDLLAACARYPYMRVFDWAAWARRKWFIPDGIHYYSPGYVARSRLIAHGLAHAFPASGGVSANCLVR